MTKEAEDKCESDKSDKNANQTVSTTTAELSQTASKKTDTNITLNSNSKEIQSNVKSEDKPQSDTSNHVKVGKEIQNKNSSGEVTGETKSAEKGQELEEEDVPGDFFDDFLKEDFMDGLDIVDDDAWDEDKVKNNIDEKSKSTSDAKSEDPKKKRKKSSSKTSQEKKRTSPSGEKKAKKKKQEEKGSERKAKKSKEKVIDADEFDIRRDPQKTKRDIERDKARCEKDKEKKIISEKLNLVETGLVPPGTEMEIDLEELKKQKDVVEQKLPGNSREHTRSLRSRSKSASRRQRSPKVKSSRKSASPQKKPSPKRRRTRSPGRQSPIRRSPRKRSPVNPSLRRSSPRKSPLRGALRRSRERSLRRSRSLSPYYRSRRARYSPLPPRRRDRTPSRESERELWLKRRRSRSRSPRRKREEKKSFLQEIAEKLNEARLQPMNMMPPLQPMHYMHPQSLPTVPAPVPAPVPPPSNPAYFTPQSQPQPQSQQQYDPYDQSFFIGTPQPVAAPKFAGQPKAKPLSAVNLTQIQLENSVPATSPQMPIIPMSLGINVASRNAENSVSPSLRNMNINAKGDVAKLFQDKKITLSEFLAVTAKPEVSSSSPAHLQEKIKVISRCQEAIKFLSSNEQKYTGKLVVQRTDNYKVLHEKNKSPLIRTAPVVFPFTHHQTKWEQKSSFTSFMNQLLQKIGMLQEAVVVIDVDETPSQAGIPPITKALAPPPPPLIQRNTPRNETRVNKPNMLAKNQLSKMVQTDVFKCDPCEKRKRILYKSSAVQCGNDKAMFSVSTQVTENDFYTKFPVTQSLASLTPAQLLAKSRTGPESSNVPPKFGRGLSKDEYDMISSNYANRGNFSRAVDNYMPRYNSPSPPMHYNLQQHDMLPPSMLSFNDNPMRSQFIGGGGRGSRASQLDPSRSMDSHRLGYNDYY